MAARLALKSTPKSVEAHLALAIASAALHQGDQAGRLLNYVSRVSGLSTASTSWGGAWTLLLLGDWAGAEAFFDVALKHRPREATFLALLAVCQARRGKLQSAIVNARRLCTPRPQSKDHARLLADMLLDGGFVREARERLEPLKAGAKDDADLMFTMVRLHLMLWNFEAAEAWAAQLKQNQTQAQVLIRLGGAYESARKPGQAAAYFNEALQAGYYPEAYLGLARLETEKRNKELARSHILSALDISRPVGEHGVGPLPLFPRIVGRLLWLQEPVLNCRAWIASVAGNATPRALANASFMIFAPDRPEAEQHFETLLRAMRAGMPPLLPGTVSWREAPREQQPDGPVRPGVQGTLG